MVCLLHFPLSLTTRREGEKLKEEDDDGDEKGREVIVSDSWGRD